MSGDDPTPKPLFSLQTRTTFQLTQINVSFLVAAPQKLSSSFLDVIENRSKSLEEGKVINRNTYEDGFD